MFKKVNRTVHCMYAKKLVKLMRKVGAPKHQFYFEHKNLTTTGNLRNPRVRKMISLALVVPSRRRNISLSKGGYSHCQIHLI